MVGTNPNNPSGSAGPALDIVQILATWGHCVVELEQEILKIRLNFFALLR